MNRAERELLLRIPGLGVRNVARLLAARRHRRLRYADLARLRCDLSKARAFVVADDYYPRLEPPSARFAQRAAAQLPLL